MSSTIEYLTDLFNHFKNMNYLHYNQEDEILTACRNGVVVEIDGFQFYLWADKMGMTRTGEEIAYMDGNSMAYDVIENNEPMMQDEFFEGVEHGEIDLEDVAEYLRHGGRTL